MAEKNKKVKILQAEAITEEFIVRCERYLATMKYVLWGQAFDVNDPARRRVAAEWLASQVVGLMIAPTENET